MVSVWLVCVWFVCVVVILADYHSKSEGVGKRRVSSRGKLYISQCMCVCVCLVCVCA